MSQLEVGADSARVSQRNGWLAVTVLALAVGVHFQSFRELWPVWMDTDRTTYTHGLLIAAISGWLVWRARPRLQGLALRPVTAAIPLVMVLSLAWLVLARAGMLTLHTALWPLLAAAWLLAACGWRIAAALAFPLAYLWFAMPLWDHLTRSLQTLTVMAVDGLNRLTRVPAEVVGDMVTIPQGRFEIAAGCSGLHFFVVALAIAALAGEVHRDRLSVRLLLLSVAAALALVSNWLRVYFIILAGYLSDMQHYLVTVDHYKFGWLLFAGAMLVFFLVLRRLPVSGDEPTASSPGRAAAAAWRGPFLAGLLAGCILPAASLAAGAFDRGVDAAMPAPPSVRGFSGPLSPSPGWQPVYVGADGEVRAAYLSPAGRVIDYYGNRYLRQAQGRELIGYRNRLFDPAVYRELHHSRSVVETSDGSLPVVEVIAERHSGQRWLLMYHYYVGDSHKTGRLETQLSSGFRSVWGDAPAGMHAVTTSCGDDCGAVREDLATLLLELSRNDT